MCYYGDMTKKEIVRKINKHKVAIQILVAIALFFAFLGIAKYAYASSTSCSSQHRGDWTCLGYGLIGMGDLALTAIITLIALCLYIRMDSLTLRLSDKNKRFNSKLRSLVAARRRVAIVDVALAASWGVAYYFVVNCRQGCNSVSYALLMAIPVMFVLVFAVIVLSFRIHKIEHGILRKISRPAKSRAKKHDADSSYTDPYL